MRVPHARWYVAGAAVAVCAAILWLTRNNVFYFDEWTFIQESPALTLTDWLKPYYEHPAMLVRLVYWILLNTVGLRTYVPYMAVLLVIHATNVVLLFELVRRRAGDLIGMSAAFLLLVLGAAWDDLLRAFQMATLASLALGLAMLLLLQGPPRRGRTAIAAGCLAASLAFSGIGLVFVVVAVVLLGLTPERRRELLWFVPVGVVVAVYYLAFSASAYHPTPPPTAANIYLVPLYVLWGLGAGVAALIGEGAWIGPPLLAVAMVALVWTWFRHRPDPTALSVAAGLIAFYVLAGATRAQLGVEQSGSSRYTYIAAALGLILLGDAARALPWRGTWRPVLIACVFLACFNSAVLLFSFATARAVLAERQMADLQALAAERSDPCLDPAGAVDLLVMPEETRPALYYRAIDHYGDPAAGRPITDRPDYDAGIRNLRRPAC